MTRSKKTFATDSGVVHRLLCLTRGGVAVCANGTQGETTEYQPAGKVDARFTDHEGDQKHIGSVRVRTRNDLQAPRSSFKANGGGVALVLELI